MKKTYRSPEILKIPIDLKDILTTSNELEPDISTQFGTNELEPDIKT